MELQILNVLINIKSAIMSLLTSIWGKCLTAMIFIASIFAPIKGLLIVTFIIVLLDAILGVTVTIVKKGKGHILSSRLRDSLIKLLFYTILICTFFLVEREILDTSFYGAKGVFAILSAVEVISIIASMLILVPNMPILKLLRSVLTKEMAKKLGIDEQDIKDVIEDIDLKNK